MSSLIKHLLLMQLIATVVLVVAPGAATASRGVELSPSSGEIGSVRATFPALTFTDTEGTAEVICEVIWGIRFHRTIAKSRRIASRHRIRLQSPRLQRWLHETATGLAAVHDLVRLLRRNATEHNIRPIRDQRMRLANSSVLRTCRMPIQRQHAGHDGGRGHHKRPAPGRNGNDPAFQ